MFNLLRPKLIYVRIYSNRVILKRVGAEFGPVTVLLSRTPGTDGALPGDIGLAIEALKPAIIAAHKPWEFMAPTVVLHAVEITSRSLSPKEESFLFELGDKAGAMRTTIFTAPRPELTDDEVRGLDEAPPVLTGAGLPKALEKIVFFGVAPMVYLFVLLSLLQSNEISLHMAVAAGAALISSAGAVMRLVFRSNRFVLWGLGRALYYWGLAGVALVAVHWYFIAG